VGTNPANHFAQTRKMIGIGKGGEREVSDWFLSPDRTQISDEEYAFGNYEPRRFGFVLGPAYPLPEPIPYRGALGLWEIPQELDNRIMTALTATAPQAQQEGR
jgi:hypothetical protein